MFKKFIIFIITCFFLTANVFAAGSGGGESGGSGEGEGGSAKIKTNFDKAVYHIKKGKKFESKGKLDKAKERYTKAQKLLIKLNNKTANDPDTLNYLGFATRKLGDFEQGEKYYLLGLTIDPDHIGINEYLGELYVATGRHNLAIERLQVLKGCNCEEYEQLEKIIAGEKVSKY
tara:strand:+ start:371 stop:892 length:522 start_codon:yes stop_codon:yes gene_type:complete